MQCFFERDNKLSIIGFSRYWNHQLCLMLLLIANICFYTEDTIPVYIIISGISFLIILVSFEKFHRFELIIDSFSAWIILLYLLYMLYGCCFLRTYFFNWDMILFTGLSNFAMYVAFYNIFKSGDAITYLRKPIICSSVFCIIYIYITSKGVLGEESVRIGDALSGNVNTVAVSLGILSMMLTYVYLCSKSKIDLCVLIALIGFSFLTGSKKAIVYVIIDFIMIMKVSKSKVKKYLVVGFAGAVVFYIIMKVPYFYSVIGHRVQDLFYQVFGIGNASFSNADDKSSEIRLNMIKEGFRIFFNNPQYYFFGGGEKFFAYESTYGAFHYSHCNYTELLCNYGLYGLLLFYFPLISNIRKLTKLKYYNRELVLFGTLGIVSILINSWLMVIYESICIYYIPAILSFVIIKILKEEELDVKI